MTVSLTEITVTFMKLFFRKWHEEDNTCILAAMT